MPDVFKFEQKVKGVQNAKFKQKRLQRKRAKNFRNIFFRYFPIRISQLREAQPKLLHLFIRLENRDGLNINRACV